MVNIKTIQGKCLEGKLDVADAVSQIDRAIGGITRVDFKEGEKFKITNHDAMFGLDYKGLTKKQFELLYGIAVLSYFQARRNGSVRPGGVHISRDASTKHYMEGIHRILNKYQGGYKNER